MLLWLLLLLLLLLCSSAAIPMRHRLDTRWRFSCLEEEGEVVATFVRPRSHAEVSQAAAGVVDVHFVVHRGLFQPVRKIPRVDGRHPTVASTMPRCQAGVVTIVVTGLAFAVAFVAIVLA